jgi:hypothetical protein
MPPKKKNAPAIKPMNTKIQGYKQPLNFNVEKALKPNKINPKEIFDMKDVPKGSHRMPAPKVGSIMKNKDMKKKKKKTTKKY